MSFFPSASQSRLIDALFQEREQHLRQAFRENLEKMERREQLSQVSGIRDGTLLDRLISLNITAETLAALEVIPLVLVAWADGRVQLEEREAIVALAEAAGVEPKDGRYPLLEHWLKRKPGTEMLEAWKHYVKELHERMGSQELEQLRHELLDRAEQVAGAAGGFLGFGEKISPAERAVLNDLEQAFS
jgi:hypothetical protein